MNRRNVVIALSVGGFVLAYYLTRKTAINKTITKNVKTGGKTLITNVRKFVTTISDYGKELIKKTELLSLTAYPDAGGFSIGYGHYLGTAATVKKINEAQADAFFNQDIANVEAEMRKYIIKPLTQNQHDALVSFFYNTGHKGFINKDGSKTQILQKLNAGNYIGAASEFDRWIYSNGVKNTALENRRATEKALFLS